MAFDSLEHIAFAAREAKRIYNRVLAWRQKIAIAIGLSILALPLIGVVGVRQSILWVVVTSFLPLTSAAAFILLVQVTRWRSDLNIPEKQRRELNGSMPVLFIESLPFVIAMLFVLGWAAKFLKRALGA